MFGFETSEFREKLVVVVSTMLLSATCLGIAVSPARAAAPTVQVQAATITSANA